MESKRRVCPDGRSSTDSHRVQNAALPGPGHHGGGGGHGRPASRLRPDGERASPLYVPATQPGSVRTARWSQTLTGEAASSAAGD